VLIDEDELSGDIRVISCGNWDMSFEVSRLETFATGQKSILVNQSISFHKKRVTCIDVNGMWLACGSEDGMVSIWRCRDSESRFFGWPSFLSRSTGFKPLVHSPTFCNAKVPSSDFKISDKPQHVLHCHYDTVTCICVSTLLDIVVSGSKDGFLVLHNLLQGTRLRTLNFLGCTLDKLIINHHAATMVLYSHSKKTLYLYSINGALLAFKNINAEADDLAINPENGTITTMVLTQNGSLLLTGGGTRLCIRTVYNLQVIHEYKATTSNICDLAFEPEERLLFVALTDGKLGVYYKLGGTKLLV